MKRCPNCEQAVKPNQTICPYCGSPLKPHVKCWNCGNWNPEGTEYCQVCGEMLARMTKGEDVERGKQTKYPSPRSEDLDHKSSRRNSGKRKTKPRHGSPIPRSLNKLFAIFALMIGSITEVMAFLAAIASGYTEATFVVFFIASLFTMFFVMLGGLSGYRRGQIGYFIMAAVLGVWSVLSLEEGVMILILLLVTSACMYLFSITDD